METSMLPILFCFLVLYPSPALAAGATAPADLAALSAFKSAVDPSSINRWSCLASWNFTSDPCRPAAPAHFICGLGCSPDGAHITAVVLDPAGYSSTRALVALTAAGGLTQLADLSLADNAFGGGIPSSISRLSSLRTLVLAGNSLSGEIPGSLSSLSSLETLDLSRNALTGGIPTGISSLSNLRTLDLSSNRISGGIPLTLPPSLVDLALRGNSISGGLREPTFAPLKLLRVVELAANKLEGEVGSWVLSLPSLQQLMLANNTITQITFPERTTAAAEEVAAALVAVDLSFNRIEGELPASLAAFPSLVSLSLRHNLLRGSIPREYWAAKKGVPFRRLFLDGNFITGAAPEQLLGGGLYAGSLGDNCLDSCPVAEALCSPVQKPESVCKEVYGGRAGGNRNRRRAIFNSAAACNDNLC